MFAMEFQYPHLFFDFANVSIYSMGENNKSASVGFQEYFADYISIGCNAILT